MINDAVRVALESGRPYTGLRGFAVDPRLWHYVPRAWAQREQVVPVLLVGDTLKLASADPDPDLSLLRSRFPTLQLDVVIAAPGEIADVLAEDA